MEEEETGNVMRLRDYLAPVAFFMVLLLWGGFVFAGDGEPAAGAPVVAQSRETAVPEREPAYSSDQGAGYPSARGKTYQLEEIVVTATRRSAPAQDLAADITVIGRKELENMPASTVAEVLQYIPGVYVEFSGGIGGPAAARIQGSEVRHTAVYIDGVPLNILANPFTDLSGLPVGNVERIEVYKGAASSAWGSALGGVINIITRDPDPNRRFAADVTVSGGEADTWKRRGSAGGVIKDFGYFLSVTRDQSDGFIDHSRYRQSDVYAKMDYTPTPTSRINLAASRNEGKIQDPVIGYPDFWDDTEQERDYQRLLVEITPTDDLDVAVEGRRHRFEALIEDVYADRREVFNDYADETWGIGARLGYGRGGPAAFTFGFDGDWGKYDWQGYEKTYRTGNWALYANNTFKAGPASVNAGVRYDRNRDFGSEISPSIGMVRHLLEGRALVRAQVARGFSAPPPAWVNDPDHGNPDLEPETAVNYRVGGKIRVLTMISVETGLFYADVDDLIRYDEDARQYVNIDRAVRKGVEGSVAAAFDYGIQVSLAAVFTDVRDKESDREIKDIPTTQYHITAVHTYKWMTHSLLGTWIDHNSSFPETRDKKIVFDYRAKAMLPGLDRYGAPSVFINIYNIFNAGYLYREVWPRPDRWVEAGVDFSF